jgi:transcriptional regulator with XRE-family HTH domain
MSTPLRTTFARLCREARTMLDVTQLELAGAVGVSRAYIASIETGRADPSIDVVERIGSALGLELQLVGRPPAVIDGPRQRDLIHARCAGYVDRRFRGLAWQTHREVTIARGRTRGWIDLLAYDPRRRILLVVEIKTWIDDLGAIERQLDWYLLEAPTIASRFGWRPVRTIGWVLALATADVDESIRRNRDVIDDAFPARARELNALLLGGDVVDIRRGIALIDPRSRRRAWLISSRVDGRRSLAPYRDTGQARLVMSA